MTEIATADGDLSKILYIQDDGSAADRDLSKILYILHHGTITCHSFQTHRPDVITLFLWKLAKTGKALILLDLFSSFLPF